MSTESRDDEADETELFQTEPLVTGKHEYRPCLLVLSGRDVGRIFVLDSDESIIGRAPGIQVRLSDQGLSRQHARIFRVGPEIWLEDLQSSNGTQLNGTTITRASLTDGDRIRLGPSTVLTFTFQESHDARFHHNLVDAAERDPATGAYTRHYLVERLTLELAYAKRHRTPLVLCGVTVEGVPDDDGERVAVRVCAAIRERLGDDDLLARTGALTFVAVIRRETPFDATRLANELAASAAPGRLRVRLGAADRETQSAAALLRGAEGDPPAAASFRSPRRSR